MHGYVYKLACISCTNISVDLHTCIYIYIFVISLSVLDPIWFWALLCFTSHPAELAIEAIKAHRENLDRLTPRNVVPLLEGPRSTSTPETVWRTFGLLDDDWVMDQPSSFDDLGYGHWWAMLASDLYADSRATSLQVNDVGRIHHLKFGSSWLMRPALHVAKVVHMQHHLQQLLAWKHRGWSKARKII